MNDADEIRDRDEKPLAGQRVVVTRPPGQADSFARRLRELGAEPVFFPTIRIVPPGDPGPLQRAAAELSSYDWVVFTSVNGVDRLAGAVGEGGRGGAEDRADATGDRSPLEGARVAAIGPATAERVEERFAVQPDVVPEEYRAEALERAVRRRAGGDGGRPGGRGEADGDPEHRSGGLEGRRVLLPRAAEARPVLRQRLEAAGAEVDEVTAYRAVPPDEEELAAARERLAAGETDWLTFTASSTVRNFVSAVGAGTRAARVAAIGPITAGTARELGLTVDVVAEEYTVPGLVEALVGAARAGDDREAA